MKKKQISVKLVLLLVFALFLVQSVIVNESLAQSSESGISGLSYITTGPEATLSPMFSINDR